jgi:hypothetical protein
MEDKEPFMKKPLFAVLSLALSLLLVSQTALFAQSAPKKVLSSKDIDAFAANFETLNGDLDALGDKYESVFAADENATPAEILAKLRTTKVPPEIQSILKKNGLGENGFEKLMVITIGFSALEMESYLNDQQAQYGSSPEFQPYLDKGMTQVKELKAAIHADDLALLTAKHDVLYPLLMADAGAEEQLAPDAAGTGSAPGEKVAPGDADYVGDDPSADSGD